MIFPSLANTTEEIFFNIKKERDQPKTKTLPLAPLRYVRYAGPKPALPESEIET